MRQWLYYYDSKARPKMQMEYEIDSYCFLLARFGFIKLKFIIILRTLMLEKCYTLIAVKNCVNNVIIKNLFCFWTPIFRIGVIALAVSSLQKQP